MKKLTIFQQVISLILTCLLLFSLLIFCFFSYVTQMLMQKNQLTEMQVTVSDLVKTIKSKFELNAETNNGQDSYLRYLPNAINSDIFIVFFDPLREETAQAQKTGRILPSKIEYNDTFTYHLRDGHGFSDIDVSEIIQQIKTTIPELWQQNSYTFNLRLSRNHKDEAMPANIKSKRENNSHSKEFMCVASSFIVNESMNSSGLKGAVYLVKSKQFIHDNEVVLNLSLLIAVSLTLLIMIVPALFIVSRLIKPLIKTRDVALALGKGDFSKRADENAPSEIGDLAKSMNQLAGNLDMTLSSLRFEKNRLQQVLNNLAEGVVAYDLAGRITHQNLAMKTMFKAYLIENNLWTSDDDNEIVWPQVLGLVNEFQQIMLRGGSLILKRQYGKMIVEIALAALNNELGNIVGSLASFRDISEQEEREQTQKDYVANVSHELRTPLTAIRGLIEPLSDGLVEDEKEQRRYYKIILDETLRLSRLINEILKLSRLQADRETVKLEYFQVSDLFASVQAKFDFIASEKKIIFKVPDLVTGEKYTKQEEMHLHYFDLSNLVVHDVVVYSNYDYLEQLLVILLDNAFKHTAENGTVQLVLSRNKQRQLLISVLDNGEGISADQQKHVFERFYKIDSSREQTKGNGLGLSIAKQLVERLGEQIYLVSQLKVGSCFSFTVKERKESAKK